MEYFTIYKFQDVVKHERTRYDIQAETFEEAIRKFNEALDDWSIDQYQADRSTIGSTINNLRFEDQDGNKIERVY